MDFPSLKVYTDYNFQHIESSISINSFTIVILISIPVGQEKLYTLKQEYFYFAALRIVQDPVHLGKTKQFL